METKEEEVDFSEYIITNESIEMLKQLGILNPFEEDLSQEELLAIADDVEETDKTDEEIFDKETEAGEEGPVSSELGEAQFAIRNGAEVDINADLRDAEFKIEEFELIPADDLYELLRLDEVLNVLSPTEVTIVEPSIIENIPQYVDEIQEEIISVKPIEPTIKEPDETPELSPTPEVPEISEPETTDPEIPQLEDTEESVDEPEIIPKQQQWIRLRLWTKPANRMMSRLWAKPANKMMSRLMSQRL